MSLTEKYRPASLDELVGREGFVSQLKAAHVSLPHCLFFGPPGTGKTTAALALARHLHGAQWSYHMLRLNASNQRTLEVVRQEVASFLQAGSLCLVERKAPKLVLLDEVDAMDVMAQRALRRMMEMYAKSARFILTCNQLRQVITPLRSRCLCYRFAPLPKAALQAYLSRVSLAEGLRLSPSVLEAMAHLGHGDARQSVALLEQVEPQKPPQTTAEVYRMAGCLTTQQAQELVVQVKQEPNVMAAKTRFLELLEDHRCSVLGWLRSWSQALDLPPPCLSEAALWEERLTGPHDEVVQVYGLVSWLRGS